MHSIKQIKARSVYDSRGIPSVEVELYLSNGAYGRFSTPSGASKGSKEALELRDGGKRLHGFGVSKAIDNILGEISNSILDKSFTQKELDDFLISLDGTKTKSRLGANAILAVSAAFYKASKHISENSFFFRDDKVYMPVPLINVLNGGKHANNGLSIQEFMIVPHGAKSFKESLEWAQEVFLTLKDILQAKGFSTAVGDEGGFAPNINSTEQALDFLNLAIEKSGYSLGKNFSLALDVAADSFYEEKSKTYYFENKNLSNEQLLNFYEQIVNTYSICSIEDAFFEDDYEGFYSITKRLGDRIQIVGDDLFVTQVDKIKTGVEKKLANSVLIKMNQVGTISETFDGIDFAKKNNFTTIASHRSGETEETFLADLAIISQTEQIKTGSMSRSERMAKYNRLLRIEEFLQEKAVFNGVNAFKGKIC